MQTAQLATLESALNFILAGNATFTLRSAKTGTRFTFKVSKKDATSPHFVSLLNGPDNAADYQYLGTVFGDKSFRHGKKSRVPAEAPSAKAFAWFWTKLMTEKAIPSTCEVWHEGRCGRCGRMLTVPESIASGIGPVCEGKE